MSGLRQDESRSGPGVELQPLSGLTHLARQPTHDDWEAIDCDPHFVLRFPAGERLPAGNYTFIISLPGSVDGISTLQGPRLYFDHGSGFREADSVPLVLEPYGMAFVARFVLPTTARRVRFDPTTTPGPFSIGRVDVRRVSRSWYYGATIARLVRARVRSPRRLAASLGRAAAVLRNGGIRGLAAALRQADYRGQSARHDYPAWISLYDTPSAADLDRLRDRVATWPVRPRISVIMPTFDTPLEMLEAAIDSVLAQVYADWELCIADDCSRQPHVRQILETYASRDPRIKVAYRSENGHIAAASNTALSLATGEWVAFLDHDDLLAPHALACVADAIIAHPRAQLLYSDEDKIDADGKRVDPYFKSDWNLELFRSHNLVTHLAVYRSARLRALGGLREGYDGAQDYDLALRFTEGLVDDEIHHIPHVLYHWRVHEESTAAAGCAKPYAMLAGERALNEHLRRCEVDGHGQLIGFGFRVDYAVPEPRPLVSIVIPTRNAGDLVERCIGSIVQKSGYRPYEILLVDNGSDDPDALRTFDHLAARHAVRILRDDRPFNYSALNNAAARQARGEVLVLLNNDIEVISPDWLDRLVAILHQPRVGAVGAKLLFPDDTIQHGGVILGLGGLAAHAHTGFHRSSAGYVGRAALQQDVSAVTGACLAVNRALFLEAGGLDEQDLTVAYNDVDFCLRLLQRGLRVIWTPFAELYHHESATRGYETTPEKRRRFAEEQAVMRRRWQALLDRDPAYNPNLTDSAADFSLAWPPRVPRPWE